MTQDQFIAAWGGSTVEQRFAAFVDWVTDGIVGYPQWVSPGFQLVNGPGSGNCDPGYRLSRATFEEPTPANAVSFGHAVIAQCSNLAQTRYIKAYKGQDKHHQKQVNKWLDTAMKDLIKDYEKAFEEMAKYFAKKYEGEKGS